jgi:hypothetical protein
MVGGNVKSDIDSASQHGHLLEDLKKLTWLSKIFVIIG